MRPDEDRTPDLELLRSDLLQAIGHTREVDGAPLWMRWDDIIEAIQEMRDELEALRWDERERGSYTGKCCCVG